MRFCATCIAVCFLSVSSVSTTTAGQAAATDNVETRPAADQQLPGITAVASIHRAASPPVIFDPEKSVAENNQRLLDRSPLKHLLVRVDASDLKVSARGAIGTPVKFQTKLGSFSGEVFSMGKADEGQLELFIRLVNRRDPINQAAWLLKDGTAGKLSLVSRDGVKQNQRQSVRGAGLR